MQAMRKMLTPRVLRAATSAVAKKNVAPMLARFQSTLIDGKEKAEESRYIRAQEEARKAELRANLEKVLAMSDESEEKQSIIAELCEYQFYNNMSSNLFLRQNMDVVAEDTK